MAKNDPADKTPKVNLTKKGIIPGVVISDRLLFFWSVHMPTCSELNGPGHTKGIYGFNKNIFNDSSDNQSIARWDEHYIALC